MDMFKKPWRIAEGFIFGGLLAVAGLLLQIVRGPVNWAALAKPANIILLLVFIAVLLTVHFLKKKIGFFAWMASSAAAVPAIAWALILTIAMGLIAQVPERGWIGNMVSFWPFVLVYIWLTSVVGLVALNHLGRVTRSWREVSATLNHLGLFVVLVCATLGSADKQTLEMTLTEGGVESVGVREDGKEVETGLQVALNDFIMETYPNGMPKRFASDVVVRSRSGKVIPGVIDVNKPMKVDGWKMYQYDYDEKAGVESKTSVLQLVKDPWLPSVFAGIFMMLAGAFIMMIVGFKKEGK